MRVLCVGGKNDGKRITFDQFRPEFTLSVPQPIVEGEDPPEAVDLERYQVEKFIAGKALFYIARPIKDTLETCMTRLVEGYKP